MATQPFYTSLRSFDAWIRATDEHAEDRLRLVDQVEFALANPQRVASAECRRLAERLERWRYGVLARRSGALAPRDRRLVDALDLAANEIARRGPRSPRFAREVIADTSFARELTAEAVKCLDPRADVGAIAERAAVLTREHFGWNGVEPVGDAAASRQSPDQAVGAPVPRPSKTPGVSPRPTGVSRAPARWRMLLYAPLYLSNYCINHCAYCGFRHPNPVPRRHLTVAEAVREAEILMDRGLRHILLVAGDFPRLTTADYCVEILGELRARGVVPSIEIAPQSTASYAAMVEAGACGLTLYQETYNEELYAVYHPRGSKVAFDWRLEGPERAAEVGMRRIGLGVLVGLADPREDLLAVIRHACYLKARFPDRTLAFSLPRIHEAPAGFEVPFPVDDDTFVRMYCALRIAFPEAELVLSTREPAALRNRLAAICITQMSAGSCTAPGGYEDSAGDARAGEQFPVCDQRSATEVAAWLTEAGFEPTW